MGIQGNPGGRVSHNIGLLKRAGLSLLVINVGVSAMASGTDTLLTPGDLFYTVHVRSSLLLVVL